MPAKATLFNHKCDAIFDFGTGARNDCFFNSFGNNILLLKYKIRNLLIMLCIFLDLNI